MPAFVKKNMPASPTEEHYLKKELYRLIKEEDEVFDFLQNAVLDGIWYWNLEIPEDEWLSPEFWQLFGIDPSTRAHSSSSWQDIIWQQDLPQVLQNFRAHCADPHHPYDQIVRYRHRDGHTVWVRCRGVAIRDAAGKPVRMLGAHTDVSELFRARQSLEERAQELEHSNRKLSEFADRAAHDLQSPLGTLIQLLDLVNFSDSEQEVEKLMRSALERMNGTIRGLLDYARSGAQSIHLTEVDSALLFHEIQQDLAAEIQAANCKIEVTPLPKLPSDELLLRQILQNLLANAVKFSPPQRSPEIRIACMDRGETWLFSCQDNGIGIPPDKLDDIFLPFRRLNGKSDFPGTGLGLASCQKAAEALHGRVWAESILGQGSCFFVELPKSQTVKQA